MKKFKCAKCGNNAVSLWMKIPKPFCSNECVICGATIKLDARIDWPFLFIENFILLYLLYLVFFEYSWDYGILIFIFGAMIMEALRGLIVPLAKTK